MTAQTENLAFEILKKIQIDIADLRRDLGDRMSNLEVRMTHLEQQIATLIVAQPNTHDRIDTLTRQVERIERRLELSE